MEYKQPNWVFGVRCSEDSSNNLWIGKVGSIPFNSVFPDVEEKIKKKLRDMRSGRTGAFWINPTNRTITVVTDASMENNEYPQETY